MKSERTSTNTKVKQKRLFKKEMSEIKNTSQDMKEELNKSMENLRRKNQTEIQEAKSSFNQIIQWKATPAH
jgi:hypothetical protein